VEAFISFPSHPAQHPGGSFLKDEVDRAAADHSCQHNDKFRMHGAIPPFYHMLIV
jgi:hypothetical protein